MQEGPVDRRFLRAIEDLRASYLRVGTDLEWLRRAVNPDYTGVSNKLIQIFEGLRQQREEMSRFLASPGVESMAAQLKEIARANQLWQDLGARTPLIDPVLMDLSRTHQTWLTQISPAQDAIAQLQATARLALGDLGLRTAVIEGLYSRLDLELISRELAVSRPVLQNLSDAMADLTQGYGDLSASIQSLPDVTRLPAFALPGATREVFVAGYALDTVVMRGRGDRERDASEAQWVAEVEQETSGCLALLQSIDPALGIPYVGAREALQSTSVDRARHALSSLRELWDHLLRHIAPDDQVLTWVPNDRQDLLHKGRPTRAARVLYVCRSLNHGPLSELIVQDTRTLVGFMELLNHVHELESSFTDEQLQAVLVRSDSWLMYILQIYAA